MGWAMCQLHELISECVDALERFEHLNLLSWFITLVLLVRIVFFQLVLLVSYISAFYIIQETFLYFFASLFPSF